MQREQAIRLCEQAVEAALEAGADAAEAVLDASHSMEASIQKNDLDQVKVTEEVQLGIRVLTGGRLGFATGNRPDALVELAREAIIVARASPVDEMACLPESMPLPDRPDAIDPELLELDVGTLARMAVEQARFVLGRDKRINIDTASISVERGTRAVVSSRGVRAAFREAAAGGGIFGMAVEDGVPGSFSYDGDQVRRLSELGPALEQAFSRFVENCIGALRPGRGESFRGPVLVPPAALGEFLVGPLLAGLAANAVRLGRSPFADKVGQRIASERFTLSDGGAGLERFPLAPFDREGLPRQARSLVENGVLKGFLYDSREARAKGVSSTGNALGGADSLPTIGAACLSLQPGEQSSETLLQGLDRGVLVTRFSGSTDPVSGDFSGVVKGGFLVRNGERQPIHETTIAGNVWRCLQDVSAISNDVCTLMGTRAWPWVRIEDLSITGS